MCVYFWIIGLLTHSHPRPHTHSTPSTIIRLSAVAVTVAPPPPPLPPVLGRRNMTLQRAATTTTTSVRVSSGFVSPPSRVAPSHPTPPFLTQVMEPKFVAMSDEFTGAVFLKVRGVY